VFLPMKIAVFPGIDGNASIERYARELARNFATGMDAEVIRLRRSPGLKGALYDRYIKYLRLARQNQADCNIIASESYSFLLLALPPQRTVVVCHDVHPLIYRGWSGTYRLRYKLNLRLMARAHAIVAISEHTKKDLLKYCPFIPPGKIFAIHNGLDRKWKRVQDEACHQQIRRAYNLEGKKIVLHVGNDNWYKNFATLLRAIAAVNDPNLVLIKVGDCGNANRELIQQLGIANRFVQIRGADDEQLMCLYSIADMLVFPSLHEGFGWPPLEAMACGCPVITTRKASLPEVCGDACLYVEPRDVEEIAAAIQTLKEEPDARANLTRRGLLQAQKFNWPQTGEAILRAADCLRKTESQTIK
jgi:glycosyltransferase involved in cell wall biosynthesis